MDSTDKEVLSLWMDAREGKKQGVHLSFARMELLLRGASLAPRWILELGWDLGMEML